VHRCGHVPYRFGGADLLSHPGARGGLDARLGASLDPEKMWVPDPNPRSRRSKREPEQAPPNRAGLQHSPGSMPKSVLMSAQKMVT